MPTQYKRLILENLPQSILPENYMPDKVSKGQAVTDCDLFTATICIPTIHINSELIM